MKIIIALAFLAVSCATIEIEPVELGEPAAPYVEPVRVADVPQQGFQSDDDLRVKIVELAEPDAAAGENLNLFENNEAFHPIAPGELESLRIQLPENYDPAYPYRPGFDPMWR